MSSVSVAIVSWNTRELLAECLQSVADAEADARIALEVCVIDNASSDGSAEMVAARFPQVRLIANRDNTGFARANNQAIAATTAPAVLMLNSDAQLSADALRRLVARLETTPRAGLVGAKLRWPDGRFQYSHSRFPSFGQEALMVTGLGRLLHGRCYPSAGPIAGDIARAVDWVGGACMFARRTALEAVGGLDEGYWLYCEEVDLCLALRRAGWEIWYDPEVEILHRSGASAYQLGPEREAHLYRSRLRFFRKHYGERSARLLAVQTAALMLPKLAVHGTLRRLSGGRIGRPTLSLGALHEVLTADDAQPAVAPPQSRRGATLLVATAALDDGQRLDREHADHPRVDYVELSRRGGIEVLNYDAYPAGPPGLLLRRAEMRLRVDPVLALHAALRARDAARVLCMSERVGLPLALLQRAGMLRVPLLVLFQAWSWRQEALITRFALLERLQAVGVNSSAMRARLIQLGAPPDRVHELRWAVDHRFYRPEPPAGGRVIFSVGEPRHRDYAGLFRAVDGLDAAVRVRMSGYPWIGSDHGYAAALPANVTRLPRLSYRQLRAQYAAASVVVLPVSDVIYPNGLTAVLEAMSTARPVVITRSRGLRDYVIDGETALVVEQNDPAALRDAIRRVLDDPALARRLGEAARARVDAELNQARYVEQLAALLGNAAPAGVGLAA